MGGILVTGVNGQVGFELMRCLAGYGRVTGVDVAQMDLADAASIRKVVREVAPDLIVHPAAYTAVDQAEKEPELALAVNGSAPGVLAEEAKRLGAGLIHYSTDYVFDGTASAPYVETHSPNPMSSYGRSKLAGERAIEAAGVPHIILRTAWVYGGRGKNFLLTMLRLAREREELRVVGDQVGAPTWCRALARATAEVIARLGYGTEGFAAALRERSGIYHATAGGQTSWHGFAAAIVARAAGGSGEVDAAFALARAPRVVAITTDEYPLPAARPAYSVLSNEKLARTFGVALPPWEAGLAECLRSGGS